MANGIRTGDPRGFNKVNNNKDEDNNPKTLNDKNHQPSSQKFRQLINDRVYVNLN